MKKVKFSFLLCMIAFISCQKEQSEPSIADANAQSEDRSTISQLTIPTTAVSFPKEVIPVKAGRIELWAKLIGFTGNIPSSGEATLCYIHDDASTFALSFSSNDGLGDGGLAGVAGKIAETGTGPAGAWKYDQVLPKGNLDNWHCYILIWNANGLKWFNDKRQVAVYIDGRLNSKSYHPNNARFPALTGGTFNLIQSAFTPDPNHKIVLDEIKIYDGNNKLVLWNTLGSQKEIEHSVVGLNGVFNGFGNPQFVKGVFGNAIIATPVTGE